ncbi:hypothetical protein H6P81_018970 [Aristolochia fimbriata]|uniref:Uncharacterized protein n=1 Tax=Aristolochia fimbriata TaxID=158543 RepID=A0AAV7E5M8_ARIFI|nr:hypothetical protein H6P81_018970 [Aristolochia fimbriata]
MIEPKCGEYGLGKCGTTIPTNKLPQLQPKKMALRDVQNETRSFVTRLPLLKNYPPKEREPSIEIFKASGIKRSKADYPVGPSSLQVPSNSYEKRPRQEYPVASTGPQSPSSHSKSGQLVYVRRKTELEQSKSMGLPQPAHQDPQQQEYQKQVPRAPCMPVFAPIPSSSLTTFPQGGPSVPSSIGKPAGVVPAGVMASYAMTAGQSSSMDKSQNKSNRHWKERYEDLQKYLKSCDESSREEYIQMLRSLSAAERSQHAIELEKRAIHLSFVEAREFQMVMALNIMDKSTWKHGVPNSSPGVNSRGEPNLNM